VTNALEIPAEIARSHGVYSEHQHGLIITTNQTFMNEPRARDITEALAALQ
jgi:hypothetical protein